MGFKLVLGVLHSEFRSRELPSKPAAEIHLANINRVITDAGFQQFYHLKIEDTTPPELPTWKNTLHLKGEQFNDVQTCLDLAQSVAYPFFILGEGRWVYDSVTGRRTSTKVDDLR